MALSFGAVFVLTLGVMAAPAGAAVTTVGSATVGLQSREAESVFDGTLEKNSLDEVFPFPVAETFANPNGGPVLPENDTYAIYWDPTDNYHGDWQHLINTFLQGVGAESGALNNVFAVDTQYTDRANQHAEYRSTFRGAYTDTDPYPLSGGCSDPHPLEKEDQIEVAHKHTVVCLTNQQLRSELETFISAHLLQKGMGTVFYLLTPPGVTVCLDGGGSTGHCSDFTGTSTEESYSHSFCSYHSDISPTNELNGDERTILYAVIPWTAGGLGDGHLDLNDQTPAYDCQDGGFDPSSKPIEEKEQVKTKHTPLEEEEFAKKTAQEKREQQESEELNLENPHQQEPNQNGSTTGTDGSYDRGLADLIINQIAVEQQDTVTDPLLNSWQDSAHHEATDECRNFFAPTSGGSVTANPLTRAGTLSNQTLNGGSYYLNDAFDLAALKFPYPGVPCLTGVSLVPQFTAPNPVKAGDIVGFDGMESNFTLNAGVKFSALGVEEPAYATYKWNFGDGSPEVTGFAPGAPSVNSPGASPCASPWVAPCAASTFHSYQYGGTYEVTLTVTDTGDNKASFTEPVTVVGPAPPAPPSPPGGGSSGAATTAGTPGTAGSGATGTGSAPKPTIPGPVASAAAVTHSLPSALSKGLVISYSVNEQVAGQFQVLLASSVAKRIGLHGALATGMPPGSAPAIVIGKAILITTKGGRNTVKIQFGKKNGGETAETAQRAADDQAGRP